jgi:hypothetical protein
MNLIEQAEPGKKVPMTIMRAIPTTRGQKRKAKRETTTIVRTLLPVDTMFNRAILADTTEKTEEVTYEDLYKIFLGLWNKRLDDLKRKHFDIIVPNVRYFSDNYAPKSINA